MSLITKQSKAQSIRAFRVTPGRSGEHGPAGLATPERRPLSHGVRLEVPQPAQPAEVPQPSEPATPVVPDAPSTPIDPDPGTPADPAQPATVPAPQEPATPAVPEPGTGF
jgi:hypothetical protein